MLPSTCNQTYENIECFSEIEYDYVSQLIQIKLGEQSTDDTLRSDDYYIRHETEMWHESFNVQWTTIHHGCYHGDLCDFEYAKKKVFEMRKLTTNFDQFQQKLAAALFTPNSDKNMTHCLSTDGQTVTCDETIRSCYLNVDNIYADNTHLGCSSQSDDQSRKQLGIKEQTLYFLNGKVKDEQSSVEYVCNHELCNGQSEYKKVTQLLMEYNLMRTPIGPSSSASNMKELMHKILLLIPLLFHFIFYQ